MPCGGTTLCCANGGWCRARDHWFPLAQSANSRRCLRMSTNPCRDSNAMKGFPLKSFSTSPLLARKPSAPSRSILPAHVRHWIGRGCGEERMSPRITTSVDTTVSMTISIGRDVAECSAMCVRFEESLICSCAE